MGKDHVLHRATFATSRLLDYFSEKELITRTGHPPTDWPLVVLKELVDNSLDAAEEAGTPPVISVRVDGEGIEVADNGPGCPAETVAGMLDFSVRVSSREAYVSPCRGAQGNALKTVVAIPYVLHGSEGHVEIAARGVRHAISLRVDQLRQRPVPDHRATPDASVREGTTVRVRWPDCSRSILEGARQRFLQVASDYAFLNPHLTLTADVFGARCGADAARPGWAKWLPTNPTSAHWYRPEQFERLVAGYAAQDQDAGRDRTVRAFVQEFRGLSATAKGKALLGELGLARTNLSALVEGGALRKDLIRRLLAAMQAASKPVRPADLGAIGREHLAGRMEAIGCEMETFKYVATKGETDGRPWLIETAFAWRPKAKGRRLVTGVNWSPGLINPFRSLGQVGVSLDSVLQQQRAGREEPVVLVLHVACPRVEYTDSGKSAVVIAGPAAGEEEDAAEDLAG